MAGADRNKRNAQRHKDMPPHRAAPYHKQNQRQHAVGQQSDHSISDSEEPPNPRDLIRPHTESSSSDDLGDHSSTTPETQETPGPQEALRAKINARRSKGRKSRGRGRSSKEMSDKEAALRRIGRWFARACYPFDKMWAIVAAAANTEVADAPMAKSAPHGSKEQERQENLWNILCEEEFDLTDSLLTMDEGVFDSTLTSIDDGIAAARHADCNAMKIDILLVLRFYQGSDTLKPDVKENRGYHHALTTAFICPAGVDPNDLEQLKRLKGGESKSAGASAFPKFLWPHVNVDKIDERLPVPTWELPWATGTTSPGTSTPSPWEGFCRSPILVKAFKRLFLSPSEANDKSYSHTRQDITKVNFASIAWTATMVRFALSSDSRFEYSPKSPLAFHYQKFYNNLMYLFEDPKQSVDACSLLDWWNSVIFPEEEDNDNEKTEGTMSIFAAFAAAS